MTRIRPLMGMTSANRWRGLARSMREAGGQVRDQPQSRSKRIRTSVPPPVDAITVLSPPLITEIRHLGSVASAGRAKALERRRCTRGAGVGRRATSAGSGMMA
jgi:hypothetical protein